MQNTKILKYLLASIVSFMVFMPMVGYAQEKKTDSCSVFKAMFNVKKEPDTPENLAGNFVDDVKVFCTAGELIRAVIDLLLYAVGSVSVIFIIIGGFQYITSGGNEEAAEKGRKTFVNAIIGLVIAIMAFAIVRVVVGVIADKPSGSNNGAPAGTGGNGGSGGNGSGAAVTFGDNNVTYPGLIEPGRTALVVFAANPGNGVTAADIKNKISELCSGTAFTNATFEVEANGVAIGGKGKFQESSTGISAAVSGVVPKDLTTGTITLSVKICGYEISSAEY